MKSENGYGYIIFAISWISLPCPLSVPGDSPTGPGVGVTAIESKSIKCNRRYIGK